MVRLLALFLSVLLALPAVGQLQTQPTGLKKMDGSDSAGGGSGTGWTYDAGEGAWIFTPPSGASDTRILSDGISLQDAAGTDIMAMDATLGATTYVAGRLAADAIEVRGSSSLAASGTITGTNIQCATSGGAVVGTLNADAGNVGRFVYVTRDGANTCTIGVTSGQTLDGVTDGTTTVPSAGWKTFVQTTSTAWVTAGSYPVTGTLSGLTAGKLILATGAAAGADSAITHNSTTGVTTFGGSGPYFIMNDLTGGATPARFGWDGSNFALRDSAGTGYVGLDANTAYLRTGAVSLGYIAVGDSVVINDDGYGVPGVYLKTGASFGWPIPGSVTQAYTETGIQVSQSKALVDATATAFSRVAVASNSYEGGVLHYTIFATDGTDRQNRSGSVAFSVLNNGGTETCVFGTAADAVNASTGTLTVTFDCAAGTDTVDLRATADTSLASTTIFTIQARVDLTSGLATVTPQ